MTSTNGNDQFEPSDADSAPPSTSSGARARVRPRMNPRLCSMLNAIILGRHTLTLLGHRAILPCLLFLPLCGCAYLLGSRHVLLATIPAHAASPFTVKATLMPSTQGVEFVGLPGQSGKSQRLRITIINSSRVMFYANEPGRNVVAVAPKATVVLFDEDITTSTNSLYIPLQVFENRTPCSFLIERFNPAEFHDAIKIYLYYSNPWP